MSSKIQISKVKFAPVVEADLPELVSLINHAYLHECVWKNCYRTTLEDLTAEFKNPTNTMIKLVSDCPNTPTFWPYNPEITQTSIIGHVVLEKINEKTSMFGLLAVWPIFHGRGYGKVLIKEVERLAKELGYETMQIRVAHFNPQLFDYYERFGYVRTGQTEWNADFLKAPAHFVDFERKL